MIISLMDQLVTALKDISINSMTFQLKSEKALNSSDLKAFSLILISC